MSEQFSGSLRGTRKNKFKSEINVVPYIDVMLVLLVIFIEPKNAREVWMLEN